jgi:hypothetical protein
VSVLLLLVAHSRACPSIDAPPVNSALVDATDVGPSDSGAARGKPRKPHTIVTIYHALPSLPDYRRTCDHSAAAMLGAELYSNHADVSAYSPLGGPAAAITNSIARWWAIYLAELPLNVVREVHRPTSQLAILSSSIHPAGPPVV